MTDISPKYAPGITEQIALEHVTADEYETILRVLGRAPNMVELGIFSVMWSEHCSYKSSRVHLKKFPVTGERVVYGPRRECGRGRYWRWRCRRLQDGEPQPPLLYRALSGRGDGRRRNLARCLHHGVRAPWR